MFKGFTFYLIFFQIIIIILISGCESQNINKIINSNNDLFNKNNVSGKYSEERDATAFSINGVTTYITREDDITYLNIKFNEIRSIRVRIPNLDGNIIQVQFLGTTLINHMRQATFLIMVQAPDGSNKIFKIDLYPDEGAPRDVNWTQFNTPAQSKVLMFATNGNNTLVILYDLQDDIHNGIYAVTYRIDNNLINLIKMYKPNIGANTRLFFDQTYDNKKGGRFEINSIISGAGPSEPTRARLSTSDDGIKWVEKDEITLPAVFSPDVPFAPYGIAALGMGGDGGPGGGGGPSVPIPIFAFFMEQPDSGLVQMAAFCAFESTYPQTCNLAALPTEQYLVNIVSSNAIILGVGTGGDVVVSDRFGQNWKLATKLSLTNNIAVITSLIYDPFSKTFSVWGYDINNNLVQLSSEDGTFWENINVSRFGTIVATPNSYCAIENDPSDPLGFGQVSCWGSNSENKLGLGNLESSSPARALIPAKIGIAQGETSPISYLTLAGGSYHMCALRTSLDKVDCWGHSGYGELGDGHNYDPNSSTPIATPVAIPNISGKIRALVAGGSHSCILDTKGQAWCWGSNQYGEINTTNTVTKYTSPTFAYYNSPFHYLSIGAGRDFTCATTATQVNCWGNNYSYPFKSMQISLSQDSNFTAISAGGGNACVLSNKVHSGNTNAWCWGDNSYGQLGNGESGGFSYTPQPVISKSDPIIFSSISQSGVTTCAIESGTGHTYCWGNNQALQTGIPDKSIVVTPDLAIKLNGKPGIFSNVSEGMLSTCLISNETNESGSIIHNTYCLGNNSLGQLGIGTTESMESEPVLVNTVIDILPDESGGLINQKLN